MLDKGYGMIKVLVWLEKGALNLSKIIMGTVFWVQFKEFRGGNFQKAHFGHF